MATRLRVVRRGFTYPADAESLAIVRASGGVSRLTPEQRARVQWREAGIGDWCDDMPPESAAIYLSRGDIEVVTVDGSSPTVVIEADMIDTTEPGDAFASFAPTGAKRVYVKE